MIKIIFLDIDGVLDITNEKLDTWGLDLQKQELLGQILTKTGAKIVLSSSWRKETLEETIKYMNEQGFLFSDSLIGVTIRGYHYIDRKTKINLSIPRGVEIKQWVDTNIHSLNGKLYSRKQLNKDYTYVILDDDSDMLLEHKDNFIHTDSKNGLTEKDVKKAIKILNNDI